MSVRPLIGFWIIPKQSAVRAIARGDTPTEPAAENLQQNPFESCCRRNRRAKPKTVGVSLESFGIEGSRPAAIPPAIPNGADETKAVSIKLVFFAGPPWRRP